MSIFGKIRRTMSQTVMGLSRAVAVGGCTLRKRITACLVVIIIFAVAIAIFSETSSRFAHEDQVEERLVVMQGHLRFLESLYRMRQEDVMAIQRKLQSSEANNTHHQMFEDLLSSLTPELGALLRNMSGTKAASGLLPQNLQILQMPFVYQLLPHLLNDPYSLRPAYHMKGDRVFSDIVLGIPTVKRDKANYLIVTLAHLVNGMSVAESNSTLIVVMVGETDMEFVLTTARHIEKAFPKQVENGLIEVISPSPSYYPDLDTMSTNLGDSMKRFKWRTKQNLDAIYLMAYAQTKGTFYLMLEDDIIAKNNYMKDMKKFTASITISNPQWFFVEFCQFGGIGKMFRSSDLIHFITYVQLFYHNMPIDWLLESYLADRVCGIDKSSKQCIKSKMQIRPKYKTSLFQHIGLYSSLKGKIQKVQVSQFATRPKFYPHENPPLRSINTDIKVHGSHTLQRAYDGLTFFWGLKPVKGNSIEFWFKEPTNLERYLFRSGNVDHKDDKFYHTVIEVMPVKTNATPKFETVDMFDEFGLADGELNEKFNPIHALRLRVLEDSPFWAILSEIELKLLDPDKTR